MNQPFQSLYSSLRITQPIVCQVLDQIGSVLSDLQTQLSAELESNPLTLAASGLVFVTNTLYKQNDVVSYSGHVYVRKNPGRASVTPNLDTHNWTVLI